MYFKRLIDDYISTIGTGNEPVDDDIEITESEYNAILSAIHEKPTDTDEYVYRLKNDLTWEACDRKPHPSPDDEVDDREALSILLGGAV